MLGYWLGVEFWGNGYAYEASRALVDYCKENLGLKQLEVSHLVGNERSKSVINKLAVTYMENKVVTVHGRDREVSVYRSEI
ncbi:Acetyltransferase (GNAT) domain-containing protein [Vibrio hangzhouensis]|uniref:Acetyltransferase (GNAT) domain-containing protein n=1 Tax=Vibrio hangzhouensis TaxID=462991 RepID=A0A1H5S3R2_9VIBR|nr:Acetyltransferase (GNAT) domain-containing protein [Vibrio hangzhouensis]